MKNQNLKISSKWNINAYIVWKNIMNYTKNICDWDLNMLTSNKKIVVRETQFKQNITYLKLDSG